MRIRKASSRDIASIQECLVLSSNPSSVEDVDPTQLQNLADLVAQMKTGDELLLLVAVTQPVEIVLGFILFKRINHLSLLFVRPDQQHQGIGRRLWIAGKKIVEQRLIELNGGGRIVTVNSSNNAIPFYEKLGFIISGKDFQKKGRTLTPMLFSFESSRHNDFE